MDKYISDTYSREETIKNFIESVDELIEDAKRRAGEPNRTRDFPDSPIEDL